MGRTTDSLRREMRSIKTLEGWNGKFDSYFCKGDEIDEAAYNYFLNILPPISIRGGQGYYAGFQVSEPDSEGIDKDGKTRTLYSTFGIKGNKYYYLGHNFKGEVNSEYEPMAYVVFSQETQ